MRRALRERRLTKVVNPGKVDSADTRNMPRGSIDIIDMLL